MIHYPYNLSNGFTMQRKTKNIMYTMFVHVSEYESKFNLYIEEFVL